MKKELLFDWKRDSNYEDENGHKWIISKRGVKKKGYKDKYEKFWIVLVQTDDPRKNPVNVEFLPEGETDFYHTIAEMDENVKRIIEKKFLHELPE